MVKELTRKMKDSGVEWIGEIPEDVDIISNKYLFKYIKGKNPKEFNSEKRGLPYIGASDLEKDGDIHDYENYSIEELPTVEKDETLVLWDGARAGLIGIGHTGYIGSTIVKVIPRVDYVDKKYWYWYLKGFQPLLLDWVGGTTIPHMNRKFINEIKFINFPLSQQKSIANFLDEKTQEIDNIISKTKKAIEEYKRYKQSLITETVTKGLDENIEMKDSGIEWVGEIPEHWDIVKFKRLFRILNGKEIKNELNRNSENAIKVYGSGGVFKYTDDFLHNKTSILFGRKGTIGKPVIAEGKFWTVDTMYYTDIIHGNLKYIYYILKAFPWEIITTQTALPSITSTDLLNKYMSVAPLKEQEQIVSYLDKKCSQIDQIISSKEKLLIEMEAYKKSLIYETVTGKREVK